MAGKYLIIFIFIIANLSFTSCSKADYEGIVIKTSENKLLLATELSPIEYEEIKGLPATKIQNDDVLGDAYYGLIDLVYEDAEKFSPGNQVEVWIDGEVLESYPLQAKAKKILPIAETIK